MDERTKVRAEARRMFEEWERQGATAICPICEKPFIGGGCPHNSNDLWKHFEKMAAATATEHKSTTGTSHRDAADFAEGRAKHRPLPPLLRLMTAAERKRCPIARGVIKYFPDALAQVANTSLVGNEQHNPGEPMRWAREKSTDEQDCIVRHLTDQLTSDPIDTDGIRHAAKLAWRALANLQRALEAEAAALETAQGEGGK